MIRLETQSQAGPGPLDLDREKPPTLSLSLSLTITSAERRSESGKHTPAPTSAHGDLQAPFSRIECLSQDPPSGELAEGPQSKPGVDVA